MRIFKRKYNQHGKTCETDKYYIEFRDHWGIRHRMAAHKNKRTTQSMARSIEEMVAVRAAGQRPGPDLLRWLERMPERILNTLAKWDIIEKHHVGNAKTLTSLVDGWKQALKEKGNSDRYCREQPARVQKIIEGCNFRYPGDMNAGDIRSWLHQQVEEDRFGISTRNHYLTAMKTFCSWLEREGHIADDPTEYLQKRKTKGDVRCKRRALKPEECARLLKAAREGGHHHGMDGAQRAILYEVALTTGLRWSELHSLKVKNLELNNTPPTITVEAAYTKNGREDTLPLRPETAERLKNHTRLRLPEADLFDMWTNRGAQMLRRDLKQTGDPGRGLEPIPYEDDKGRVADFHALRHTFITNLARSGVHPKTAQTMARHSDISLTMDRYTAPALLEKRSEAVDQLPDLDKIASQKHEAATGTDGNPPQSVDPNMAQNMGQQWVNTGQNETNDPDTIKCQSAPRSSLDADNRTHNNGTPKGIRTPVTGMRIRRPRPG